MSDTGKERIEQAFQEFNDSWLAYWNEYIDLQNQLYENLKAARDVAWLVASDTDKLRKINAVKKFPVGTSMKLLTK